MPATEILAWVAAALAAAFAAYERFISKNVWRNVAEGREARISDLEAAVARLEAKVDVLTVGFADIIAEAVIASLDRRHAAAEGDS